MSFDCLYLQRGWLKRPVSHAHVHHRRYVLYYLFFASLMVTRYICPLYFMATLERIRIYGQRMQLFSVFLLARSTAFLISSIPS